MTFKGRCRKCRGVEHAEPIGAPLLDYILDRFQQVPLPLVIVMCTILGSLLNIYLSSLLPSTAVIDGIVLPLYVPSAIALPRAASQFASHMAIVTITLTPALVRVEF